MKTDNKNTMAANLGSGMWIDADGNLHFSIPDMLDSFGLPHTEENWNAMKQIAMEIVKKESPNTPIIYRESPQDKGEDIR